MSLDFYPGQQVVCVDDKVPLIDGSVVKDKAITEGQVYTLSWVGVAKHYVFGEYLGVCLEGIASRFGAEEGRPHMPYAARRFRPLVKDRLAVFRRIAADPDYKIDAPEGPVRDKPVREGVPGRRQKEEV